MGEVIPLTFTDKSGVKRRVGEAVIEETQEGVNFSGTIFDGSGPDVA